MLETAAYHALRFFKRHKVKDCQFDISQIEKYMTRSTLRTYERTETYVFLNLRKKTAEDYKFERRISLTLEETGDLEKSSKTTRRCKARSPSKTTPAKTQKFNQCSKDAGSNL